MPGNKSLLRMYTEICLLLAVCLALLGFVCPFLMSMKDTSGVLAGFFLLLVVPPFVWIFAWHIWLQHIKPLVKGIDNENGKGNGAGKSAGA